MRSSPTVLDRQLLHLQQRAFAYFLNETNPDKGLVLDKTAPSWPASVAATGLALAAYPVAVERGFMTHRAALERSLATLRFFRQAPHGPEPDATGHRGFYYHFLDMHTGRRAWQCELSSVDTAFLLAGMLSVAQYFAGDTAEEREVRDTAEMLYLRADWAWMLSADGTLRHGWKPESGFLAYCWQGYDEAMLLYVLALGSPTHPVPTSSYAAWCSTYEWMRCYDIEHLYSGPLFTHQLSHVWIDFRGIQDAFMRDKGIDYFENSRRATHVQQRYAIDNPLGYSGYGAQCWGITASDGPGPALMVINGVQRRFYDYEGRGAPYGIDDGTLSPWAVVASLPFAADIVLPAIDHFMHTLQLHDRHAYGFKATFNATLDESFNQTYPGDKNRLTRQGWVSPYHFGLNVGPIVLMIENHRNGAPWQMMRECRFIVDGLRRAGFTGGWL